MKSTNSYSNYEALFECVNYHNTNNTFSTTPVVQESSTLNVHNLLQFTIPDGKLFYPEPFIASPSYLHSDLSYLHIFQY